MREDQTWLSEPRIATRAVDRLGSRLPCASLAVIKAIAAAQQEYTNATVRR